jgi:hypothetical protein
MNAPRPPPTNPTLRGLLDIIFRCDYVSIHPSAASEVNCSVPDF